MCFLRAIVSEFVCAMNKWTLLNYVRYGIVFLTDIADIQVKKYLVDFKVIEVNTGVQAHKTEYFRQSDIFPLMANGLCAIK